MSYLRGKELAYYKDIDYPQKILRKILRQIEIIYKKAGIIHGDLGEFNIVIDEKGNILIIDWIQWVTKNHPNAQSLLERDINNICEYFKKKFKLQINTQDVLKSFYK